MSLHDKIMNIPDGNLPTGSNQKIMYKMGHRDARHAAAEMAIELDERCEQLREAVRALMDFGNRENHDNRATWAMDKARAALKAAEE